MVLDFNGLSLILVVFGFTVRGGLPLEVRQNVVS